MVWKKYGHLIAILLIICLVTSLYYFTRGEKDGFFDLNSDQSAFLDTQRTHYNSLGVSLIAGNNEGSLGTETGSLTGTVIDSKLVDNYKLTGDKSGIFAIIKQCEALKTADCSVFDNAEFKKNCAVCLSPGGTNSQGVQSIGGRVLLESDRVYTDSQPTPKNVLVPPYQPTVGTCPAGKLVSTKAQCLALEKQLACENGANYGLPGCSQCFSDSSYSIVDQKVKGLVTGTGTLNLIGQGALFFVGDRNDIRQYSLSMTTPIQIVLPSSEMTPFYLYVFNSSKDAISVGGYLTGPTVNGTFNIDLYRVIASDLVDQRKPHISKKSTLNGVDVSIMAPIAVSASQDIFNIMVLVGTSPFSFVDTTTPAGAMCPSSPFITTQAGAEYLGSDPCYTKGSGPGAYKLECLQNLFLSNGCLQNGTGYPSNAVKAGTLMTNADGSPRSLDDIATYIYSQATLAATGLINGVDATIGDWDVASKFCTGKPITSPCDTSTKNTGPLTKECLNYLWLNKGASNPLGETYSAWSRSTSLFKTGQKSRYCTPAGTMSPLNSDGTDNTAAIQAWQRKGGVAAVKAAMSALHENANAQGSSMSDTDRSTYMSQCYGPMVIAPLATAIKSSCPYPTGSDSESLCSSIAPFSPQQGRLVGTVNIPTGNYTMKFTITPKGLVSNWSNLIHVTNGGDCCTPGNRSPGVWFWPGTTELHIRHGDPSDGNWGLSKSYALPINVATPVSIVMNGSSVTITIGSTVYNLIQPRSRPTGSEFNVYMSDPWYPAMNATVTNFMYTVDGIPFIPNFNYKPIEATVREHCDATSGWARKITGAGTFQAGSAFPGDTSYIVVPAGVKAVLTNRQGVTQTVIGPSDFNFCSRGGFNDNVANIVLSAN